MLITAQIDRDRSTNYFERGWFAHLKLTCKSWMESCLWMSSYFWINTKLSCMKAIKLWMPKVNTWNIQTNQNSIFAMLKHKVEEHVLKSTSLKLNEDSSSPELSNWQLTKQWHSFPSFINCVHHCLVYMCLLSIVYSVTEFCSSECEVACHTEK